MTDYIPTPEDEHNEKLRMAMIEHRNSLAVAHIQRINASQKQLRIDNPNVNFLNETKDTSGDK